MNKKYLIVIIFLVLALIASLYLVLQTTIFTKKATSTSSTIALENSYLFVSPLQVKADGKEKMRLTIFVLDGRGMGVPNQTVTLSTSNKIEILSVQNLTDESGKAVFDLTSTTPGQFNVSAKSGNISIPQEVKVIFY